MGDEGKAAMGPHKTFFNLVTYLGSLDRARAVLRPVMERFAVPEVDGALTSARALDGAGISPVEALPYLTEQELQMLAVAWCGTVVGRGRSGRREELLEDLRRAVEFGDCDDKAAQGAGSRSNPGD